MNARIPLVVLGLIALAPLPHAFGQFGGGIGGFGGGGFGGGGLGGMGAGGGLGGVYVDPEGVLHYEVRPSRRAALPDAPDIEDSDLKARSNLRQISLRRVAEQLDRCRKLNEPVPPDVLYLAGMVKLQYVMLDPENRDVLIGGAAEGWKVSSEGRLVGRTSGRPVVQLVDLLTAFRCVLSGPGVVTCSLDPQPTAVRSLNSFLQAQDVDELHRRRSLDGFEDSLSEAFGLQVVRVEGVPKDSRFGLVMVEADYRMKRMAIGVDEVRGITSHFDSSKTRTREGSEENRISRWWFAPYYDKVLRNEEGTVFELQGQGMQLMNEEVFAAKQRDGLVGSGRVDSDDEFAESFTKLLPQLERRYEIFADLHNLYDLVMLAGIVRQQNAGTWLGGTAILDGEQYPIATAEETPTHAAPVAKAAFHGSRKKWYFTYAYGGVSMNPASVLGPQMVQTGDASLASVPAVAPSLAGAASAAAPAPAAPTGAAPAGSAPAATPSATAKPDGADAGKGTPSTSSGGKFWADVP